MLFKLFILLSSLAKWFTDWWRSGTASVCSQSCSVLGVAGQRAFWLTRVAQKQLWRLQYLYLYYYVQLHQLTYLIAYDERATTTKMLRYVVADDEAARDEDLGLGTVSTCVTPGDHIWNTAKVYQYHTKTGKKQNTTKITITIRHTKNLRVVSWQWFNSLYTPRD